jgi:Putative esterase
VNLTGAPLLALLGVLTAGLFALIVGLWPRLTGRGLRGTAERFGLLAVAQLALLCTLAAGVNAYFGFYTSWGELAGAASQSFGPVPMVAPIGMQSQIKVLGVDGLAVPGGNDPAKAGQIQSVELHGERTGLSTNALVYLPPQYFQPAYAHRLFPAAIVSTGYPGTVPALVSRLRYPIRLLAGLDSGRDRPIVLIMIAPSPASVDGRDTECTDVPGGPQVESFWAQDIPAAAERAYRVTSAAAGWGAIGDSTGGYCALKVAMMNSDRFSAAVSLSGDYYAPEDNTTGDLYDGSRAFRDENNLLWRLEHLPSPPIAALLTTSINGEENYRSTLRFVAEARRPMRVSTLIRTQGGHNFNTWNAEIPAALQWLSTHLSVPIPV